MSQTILVIEDNYEMSQNIEEILDLAHFSVLTAPDGKKGVELATQHRPDLILCDIMMPELDGYGVLHILSRDPSTADIPFIFLSAKAEKQDFRTAMNMGATDYITKPFDDVDLLRVIEVRLKKTDLIKNRYQFSPGRHSDFFEKICRLKGFHQLMEMAPVRHYRKKQFVYLNGEQPHELFYIQSGELKTYMSNKDGKELITGFHSGGNFIGYTSIFNNTVYQESAMVLSDNAQVQAIGKQEFYDLIFTSNELALHFIHILSSQISMNEQRMLELAYHSVRQKVAGALLQILENTPQATGSKKIITESRRDISCLVGTATETLNRTLLDFKEEKLIDITEEGIVLLNLQKLKKLQD